MKLDNKVIMELCEHEIGYEYGRARIVDATNWKPVVGDFDFQKTIVFELDGRFWTVTDKRYPHGEYPAKSLKTALSRKNSWFNVEGESEVTEVIKRTICGSVWRFLGQEYYSVEEIYDTVLKRYKNGEVLDDESKVKDNPASGPTDY